jgi:glutamate transport system permease protein
VDIVFGHLDVFVGGVRTTVFLTITSFAVAMVVGITLAACRVSPIPPLRIAATFYVETVRNTPLTALFLLFFFGLTKVGIRYSGFVTAVIVLGGYTGAFVGEAVRSGINAVSRGQAEAARAIGLTFWQTLIVVILPQALRTVVAPIGSLFIALIKNSSIAGVIAVPELVFRTDLLTNATARPIPIYIGAVVAYLALTIPSGVAFAALERRAAIKR